MAIDTFYKKIFGFLRKAAAFVKRRLDRVISPQQKEALAGVILYSDSPTGRRFDKILIAMIILSVVIVIIETMPNIPKNFFWILYGMEWLITILFTIEYILRVYVERKPLKYILSFYGIVDLLSFLPSYLSLFILGSQHLLIIRVLRLLRVFRIFKLGHFVSEGGIVVDALKASKIKIYVFLSFVFLMSILIGTLMYMVEHPYNDQFLSIPSGIYWSIVTITTVGYGDVAPVTYLGRFLATFVMILGYGVLAVPTGIVTSEISNRVRSSGARDTRTCRNCGEMKHFKSTYFCHNCGVQLHNEEEE